MEIPLKAPTLEEAKDFFKKSGSPYAESIRYRDGKELAREITASSSFYKDDNRLRGKVVSYKLSIELNLGDSNEDIITRSKILNLIVNSDSTDELVLKVKDSDLILDEQQIKDMESITKNIYKELNSRLDLRKESFKGINEKTKEEQIKGVDEYIGRVLENYKNTYLRVNKNN